MTKPYVTFITKKKYIECNKQTFFYCLSIPLSLDIAIALYINLYIIYQMIHKRQEKNSIKRAKPC